MAYSDFAKELFIRNINQEEAAKQLCEMKRASEAAKLRQALHFIAETQHEEMERATKRHKPISLPPLQKTMLVKAPQPPLKPISTVVLPRLNAHKAIEA